MWVLRQRSKQGVQSAQMERQARPALLGLLLTDSTGLLACLPLWQDLTGSNWRATIFCRHSLGSFEQTFRYWCKVYSMHTFISLLARCSRTHVLNCECLHGVGGGKPAPCLPRALL